MGQENKDGDKKETVLVKSEEKLLSLPIKQTKKLKRDTAASSITQNPHQPLNIPLISDVLLLETQELLAHNYPALEEETLSRLTEARKRIREHIATYSDELRIKRDMLDALHETL